MYLCPVKAVETVEAGSHFGPSLYESCANNIADYIPFWVKRFMKYSNFQFHVRAKRQSGDIRAAEKSGVPIFDYAYGSGPAQGPSHLSVYPTLMGEDDNDQNKFLSSSQSRNQNSFQDHNQLGILRSQSHDSDPQKSFQSAYARVEVFFV